ncbi:hypothetical protein [Halorussus sp. MSC15.2]|uniref:hypothetical protein n=1 Tax=Halorussus sp. MSC15.2 TaxID=2283638 RepID=UPI0013D2AE7C|nr:hypothetical protein [Halorussus sp. MSC15.2]NEU58374.1 hypothetical protein [Halorussus sp. MSC15.2]
MSRDGSPDLAAKLDRITYLLVVVVVLQLVNALDLGVNGLALLAVVGFFFGMLYNADL